MQAHWFGLFLYVYALGCLGSLLPLSPKEVGTGMVRTVLLTAVASLLLGLVWMPLWPHGLSGTPALSAAWAGMALCTVLALGLAAAPDARLFRSALGAGCLAGAWGLGARVDAWSGGMQGWWHWVAYLSAAALLGTVMTSMILGHWYLVRRGLSFGPLQRMSLLFGGAVLLRTLIVGAFVLAATQGAWAWPDAGVRPPWTLPDLYIWLARLLFGLAAPIVLAYMVWDCAKMRSNQSATGILYSAVVLVLAGELMSLQFVARTGYPL